MTWVWLKVGAKYDKCKYLLQKVREKVRIMKYKKWAHVTQLDVYLTNSAGHSGTKWNTNAAHLQIIWRSIDFRWSSRSFKNPFLYSQALLKRASIADMRNQCWNVQASLKCSVIAEMCNHCWNSRSLLTFLIIAEMRKHCWHAQAMLKRFISRDTLLLNRINFEIYASVLNWIFIKAARPKVLKTFSFSKELPQVIRKMFCQNSLNEVYS